MSNFLNAALVFLLIFNQVSLFAEDIPATPNLYPGGDMNDFFEQANPWGGVDASGHLRGIMEGQLAVNDAGRIGAYQMGPGVALGDLNGDGLLDLVIGDPKGFIWYFPNSGSKTEPKFTSGEIMPVWLGSVRVKDFDDSPGPNRDGVMQNYVPRLQLVDYNGDGKLDLVIGTYPGKLFFIPNTGSSSQPKFVTPVDLGQVKALSLRADGRLDCNYLSPFLYDLTGNHRLDLMRGDGTYSANSIYLFTNKGSSIDPIFNEENQTKIIAGMGREHLTPIAFDWNNDGKPDIVTGERTGEIEVFLNTGSDKDHPSFDSGQKLTLGSQVKFGQFTTIALGGLTGNSQVPDLLFANDTGQIFIAHNTGTAGAPKFTASPQPVKGINPFPKILVSKSWALGWWDNFHPYPLHGISEGTPDGVPYEILAITNAQKEPSFVTPPGVKWKNALKYYVQNHKNIYFPESFYPRKEDELQRHHIAGVTGVNLSSDARYQLSFWIKGSGIHDLKCLLKGREGDSAPGSRDYQDHSIENPVNLTDAWNRVTEEISWTSSYDQKNVTIGFGIQFNFIAQGTVYISDVEIHKIP